MTARKFKVHIDGGWSGDGTMHLSVEDPHNRGSLLELEIPLETFTNALRNHHSFEPPLGELTVWVEGLKQYGMERQNTRITVPYPAGSDRTDFTAWATATLPEGWALLDTGWNGHRRHRHPDGHDVYDLTIFRIVEPGTPAEVVGHPNADVHSNYRTVENWGTR